MEPIYDRELATRWIAALESGEYTQTHGRLKRGNSYCCLGVLCDLVDNDAWLPDPNREGGFDWKPADEPRHGFTPPVSLMSNLNLHVDASRGDDTPWTYNNRLIETLISVNDEHAGSFPEIAALLRDYYATIDQETAQ